MDENNKTEAMVKTVKTPVMMGTRGVQFQSLEEMFRFSEAVIQSGLAPQGFKNPQAVLIALEMGMEVGLPPMMALQSICVINNVPSLWGDAALALCMNSGLFDHDSFDEHLEDEAGKKVAKDSSEAWRGSCTVRRLPNGKPRTQTFSLREATVAGLLTRTGWKTYPSRMLQMRARALALRDTFPDILKGFGIAEEVRDWPATDGGQIVVEPTATKTDRVEAILMAENGSGESGQPVEPKDETPVQPPEPKDRELTASVWYEKLKSAGWKCRSEHKDALLPLIERILAHVCPEDLVSVLEANEDVKASDFTRMTNLQAAAALTYLKNELERMGKTG
jgi:hypothetical protein